MLNWRKAPRETYQRVAYYAIFFGSRPWTVDCHHRTNRREHGLTSPPTQYRLIRATEQERKTKCCFPTCSYTSRSGEMFKCRRYPDYWLFKHFAIELTPIITHIVNPALIQGKLPLSWRIHLSADACSTLFKHTLYIVCAPTIISLCVVICI